MIPVNPLAMMLGSLMLLISIACLGGLILWLLACLHPRSRRFMCVRRWRFGLLAAVLAVGSLPTLVFLGWLLDDWREQQALSPRLEREEILGDLVLPAGTRVWLESLEPMNDLGGEPLPYGLQSVKRAEFDRVPGMILGMRVRRLDLDASRGTAELQLLDTANLQGWPCSPEAAVSFDYPFNTPFVFAGWRLERCTLAPGSEVAGVAWPAGVTVHADESGWQLQGDGTPTRFQGLDLHALTLWLDAPAGEVQSWRAELATSLDLGPMRYPSGTRVRAYRDHLLFSPNPDAAAVNRQHGTSVEVGQSVEQSRAGEMLGIHRNEDVGVIDWDILEVP
ncbi:hypothetical protein SAMN05216588_13038 [Pseudomonas flavescens]|uniref:Uncharacterized protein n=1 Tax=Phytopseudomonas flavescens TaxID=29435 RepID=A0A1G8PS35_9GAMM|nr:hypothetical protein [Pseudomonas flavescens]SDI95025.1 hypothetical protein SAMN05216588_13038 [Pseudomonas flavescens]